MITLLRTVSLFLIGLSVVHAGTMAEQVRVENAMIRLAPPGALATAGFMTLHNGGTTELRLISASSPIARSTELHNHYNEGGMMKMRAMKEIIVPAGGHTALHSGGLHLMMIELLQALRAQDTYPLTLVFADGSKTTVSATVRPTGGNAH